MPGSQSDHHVVIVGGGFGGLTAARALRRAAVRVTLIDRRNHHLFQPLLYQVATGGLSPANIAAPLRSILKRQKNVTVLLAEVVDFDVGHQRAIMREGTLAYDSLILAAGCRNHYFGHDAWEAVAPGLKSIADATRIRQRILLAFERAGRADSADEVRAWLTLVIIGAGPTGVELAGAIAEIARHTLRHDFRRIDPGDARIMLVDAADDALPAYPEKLRWRARESLARLGVTVRTGVRVTDIRARALSLAGGAGSEAIEARTILWAAGLRGAAVGHALAQATMAEMDGQGRIVVAPDLSLPGHPNILVVGDLACFRHQADEPLPGVAPVAIQQGRYAAQSVVARLRGRSWPPFRYRNRGNMATIGRSAAVADLGWLQLAGYPAWLTWLFVHLMYIVGFQNRLLVFIQWAWNYVTRNRSARLIINERTALNAERTDVSAKQ